MDRGAWGLQERMALYMILSSWWDFTYFSYLINNAILVLVLSKMIHLYMSIVFQIIFLLCYYRVLQYSKIRIFIFKRRATNHQYECLTNFMGKIKKVEV